MAVALVGVALMVGAQGASADETATATAVPTDTVTVVPSPSVTVVPSETATPVPSTTATAVPSTTATTVPSTTATAVPTTLPGASPTAGSELDKLAADLDQLETALGPSLSPGTVAAIGDVRARLNDLAALTSGLQDGPAPSDAEAQFRQDVHDLGAALRDLRHGVQVDLHGLAADGNGREVAELHQDVSFVKHDLDRIIRDERQQLQVALGQPDSEDAPASPTAAASPTVDALPTAEASPTVEGSPIPAGQADASAIKTGLEDERSARTGDDSKGHGRDREPGLAPVPQVPPVGVVVQPAPPPAAAARKPDQADGHPPKAGGDGHPTGASAAAPKSEPKHDGPKADTPHGNGGGTGGNPGGGKGKR